MESANFFSIAFICLFFRAYESLSFFRFTHYLFNYEYEFLKRGLIGEILRLSFENINYKLVQLISLIFIIVLSIIIFKIFVKNFNKKSNISRLIFSVMIFTSPLTIQHFIYDIGRFDIINLIITFLCFFIIEKFYKNSLLIFFTTGILISLMLLIHEGALIMFVPMIFGYWFFKNSEKHTIITQIILFIIILFLAFKISLTGISLSGITSARISLPLRCLRFNTPKVIRVDDPSGARSHKRAAIKPQL